MVDRERAGDLHLLAEGERAGDDLLRQLIGGDGGDDDRGQADPLPQPGAERSLGGEDRPERVRRRPDADVERQRLAAGGLVHRPSRLASSMQSVAEGIASSRSTGISLPHTAQVPYSPDSILASALSI